MTPKERLYNRILGRETDRIPQMNIVMMFAAKESGYTYSQVVRDARKMADGMIRCYEKYGIDCLWGISDSVREPGDAGAMVIVPEGNAVPYCPEPLVKGPEDIARLRMISPCDGPAMSDRIELIRILKEYSRGEVPVVGWVEGALAAACNFMGVEDFLMLMLDEPDSARELLDYCSELELSFALEQVRAGADMIGIGESAASLIGPRLYDEFAFGYERGMTAAIKDAGAAVKLHICGNINHILEPVCSTGADIIDCDYMVDMQRAARLMEGRGCVAGNFNPVTVMMQGSPEEVAQASLECAAFGDNTIVAAGCEVPVDTPPENMLACAEALKDSR